MTDDHEALVSENERLRKSRDRWEGIAIARVVLVFVVMLPFTIAVFQLTEPYVRMNRPSPKVIGVKVMLPDDSK